MPRDEVPSELGNKTLQNTGGLVTSHMEVSMYKMEVRCRQVVLLVSGWRGNDKETAPSVASSRCRTDKWKAPQ